MGGGGGSNSSGESISATTPGFMEELGTVLNQNLTGQTGFGKQDAINDVYGVMRQQATNALQESMPKIASMQSGAGAYGSTTKELMRNDLQARIVGQLAATQSQAIKDYAAIDADRIRAFSAATQAGTSSAMQHWESSKSRNRSPWANVGTSLGSAVIGGTLSAASHPDFFQDGGIVPRTTEADRAIAKFLTDFKQLDNAEQAGFITKQWAEDARKGKMEFKDGTKTPKGPAIKPEGEIPPAVGGQIPTYIPPVEKPEQAPRGKKLVKSDADDDLSGLFARLGNV